MNDEKLIELVRNYPVLYDLSNAKYMDTNFKNTIWRKIGDEMKTTGTSCKTRWGNIRDNFRKSLKKTKTVSGQKAKTAKPYKYSEQLNFLKKFFDDRETMSNIDAGVTSQDSSGDDEVNESPENEENTQNDTVEDNNSVTVELNSPTPQKKRKGLIYYNPYFPILTKTNDTMFTIHIKGNYSTFSVSVPMEATIPADTVNPHTLGVNTTETISSDEFLPPLKIEQDNFTRIGLSEIIIGRRIVNLAHVLKMGNYSTFSVSVPMEATIPADTVNPHTLGVNTTETISSDEFLPPLKIEQDNFTRIGLSEIIIGRRIVNLAHVLKMYEKVAIHPYVCTMGKMKLVNEVRKGIFSFLNFYWH
ncbi:hypothetical protein FQR65_LT16073 [Abscondita terminalis]|nr:hypothetical protein FQR65_LT16073 [Abscondita terminalis]